MFNQSPDWKVPNPDDFTNKLMEEIRVRVTELQDKKPTFPWTVSQDRKDISSDLAYKISSLTESIKGILNISNKQHYNPAVFAKENLTCIAHLLNVFIIPLAVFTNFTPIDCYFLPSQRSFYY